MKDIVEEIDSRIKAPLFGYYLFSVVAINWEALFYLTVDDGKVVDRIYKFNELTSFLSLIVYPVILAAVYSIVYPWINLLFMFFSVKPTEYKNAMHAESESKLLMKRQQLEEVRSKILKSTETELIERAKRDVELESIEDESVREKLQDEIGELRKRRDNDRLSGVVEAKYKLSKEHEEMIQMIASAGGSMYTSELIEKSQYDKVKTEFYIEDLEDKGYVTNSYDVDRGDEYYELTTKSKKIMVEKGVVQ